MLSASLWRNSLPLKHWWCWRLMLQAPCSLFYKLCPSRASEERRTAACNSVKHSQGHQGITGSNEPWHVCCLGVAIAALRDLGDTEHSSTMPNLAMRFYVPKNWFCAIWPHSALHTNSSGEAFGRNILKTKARIPFQKCKQGLRLRLSHPAEGKPAPLLQTGILQTQDRHLPVTPLRWGCKTEILQKLWVEGPHITENYWNFI